MEERHIKISMWKIFLKCGRIWLENFHCNICMLFVKSLYGRFVKEKNKHSVIKNNFKHVTEWG